MPPSLSLEGPETNMHMLPDGSVVPFQTRLFSGDNGSAHLVLSREHPTIERGRVRIASECTIGQGVGSVLCDCGSQLRKALAKADNNTTILFSFGREYEGRGVGPKDHFRAYVNHTKHKLSSAEAYKSLNLPIDPRRYDEPIAVLQQLGFSEKPFVLLSNSEDKLRPLIQAGLQTTRQGFEAWLTERNAAQIRSRKDLGHQFSAETEEKLKHLQVQNHTVEECLRNGIDLRVEPEHIAQGVERFGPVTLPIAINRLDDNVSQDCQMYFFSCNGRMYHVVVGSPSLSPNAEVAALPACIPGDNFASMRCDCRQQLRNVMGNLQSQPDKTVFVYALTHHSQDPHAKIPLDALRAHAFNGERTRKPMDIDHPDVKIILDSLSVQSPRPMVMA